MDTGAPTRPSSWRRQSRLKPTLLLCGSSTVTGGRSCILRYKHTQELSIGNMTPRPRLGVLVCYLENSRPVPDKVLRYSWECSSNCGGGHLKFHLYLMSMDKRCNVHTCTHTHTTQPHTHTHAHTMYTRSHHTIVYMYTTYTHIQHASLPPNLLSKQSGFYHFFPPT